MSVPASPPLGAPSSKERKYDRQLRLWGASGQQALEATHVLLIGATAVGTEALKNLVLPGVGAFTVFDLKDVAEEDLGVNFFIEKESLGKPRAEEVCRCLQELNPDVKGHWMNELASTKNCPLDLTPYTLVLFTSAATKEPNLEDIARSCRSAQIPLFYIRSVGFYGSLAAQLPSCFPVIDTHPDPESTSDLRLLKPWPALVEYASRKSRDLDKMGDHEHGHVPYLVLLLHYLEAWKEGHEGRVPSNYKEKNEFRALVREGMRTKNAEGGEENFEEAIGAVLKNLNDPAPSSVVTALFEAPEATALTTTSTDFWFMVRALSQFVQKHGVMPLSGTVPDMKAQSADYMELQAVYKSKAREDVTEMVSRVRNLESAFRPELEISEKDVEALCKGAGHIKVIRGLPLFLSHSSTPNLWNSTNESILNALDDDSSLALLYLVLLSYDVPLPLESSVPDPLDLAHVRRSVLEVITSIATFWATTVDEGRFSRWMQKAHGIMEEVVRARGGELHSISSFVGGLVAQEAIKVITKQYVPVDNTCVFDGIKSITAVLRL